MSRHATASPGFTSIEVMMTLVIVLLSAFALSSLLGTSKAIERHSRADLLLESDVRSNLIAVAGVLRNVPDAELDGFDSSEVSTRPTFRRVVGGVKGKPTLGAAAFLEWRASSGGRSDDPGGVYLVEDGVATLLAPKVSSGSFVIHRVGSRLRIELEARRATGDGDTVRARTGQLVIALRN